MLSENPPFDPRAYNKIKGTFDRLGHETLYVNWIKRPSDNKLFDEKCKDDKTIAINGYISNPETHYLLRSLQSIRAFRDIFNEIKKLNPDLLFISSPFLMPLAIIIKHRLGIPWIYDIYEDYYGLGIERFIINFLELIFSKDALFLIATTESIKEKFNRNSETVVVYSSIPTPKKEISNLESIKEKLGFDKEDIIISYIGKVSTQRGVDKLITAIENIDDSRVKLLIIGGPKSELDELGNRIEYKNRVKILNEVPFDKIRVYYQLSDIGVIPFQPAPNHVKTLPNKLFEYVAYNVPVIASNIPEYMRAFPEESGALCFVDTTDPILISNKIVFLLSDENLRNKMVINAYKLFLKKYSWEVQESKLGLVLNNL